VNKQKELQTQDNKPLPEKSGRGIEVNYEKTTLLLSHNLWDIIFGNSMGMVHRVARDFNPGKNAMS
jgi:hypothetical protein